MRPRLSGSPSGQTRAHGLTGEPSENSKTAGENRTREESNLYTLSPDPFFLGSFYVQQVLQETAAGWRQVTSRQVNHPV